MNDLSDQDVAAADARAGKKRIDFSSGRHSNTPKNNVRIANGTRSRRFDCTVRPKSRRIIIDNCAQDEQKTWKIASAGLRHFKIHLPDVNSIGAIDGVASGLS